MNGRELKRFSEAVLALHECARPVDLAPTLLRALQLLLAADSHVLNWIGTSRFEDISTRSVEVPRETSLEVFNTHVQQHPLIDMVERCHEIACSAAYRWSDRTSFRSFQQTALYHDFFRHTATRHQFALTIKVSQDAALGLSFNREQCDFRDEDLRLMELFAPHIQQMIGTMQGRLELEQTLALCKLTAKEQPAIIVDEQGRLLFATEEARQWMHEHFLATNTAGLPLELATWIRRSPPTGEKLIHQARRKRLTCTCGEWMPWPEGDVSFRFSDQLKSERVRCVRLHEEREDANLHQLQRLGLTAREAEVLFWMTEGKRNSEIAIILGTSERTVDKHREHLFAKLEVDNRTSAVARAWETMHI